MAGSFAAADLRVRDGVVVVTLSAGPFEVDVIPARAMLGTSIRFEGLELLAYDGAAADPWRRRGAPLLHPWANRLPRGLVPVVDTDVVLDLDDDPMVHRDLQGLPLHGAVLEVFDWRVLWLEADDGGDGVVFEAALAFGEHPELLATFPFPHRIAVRWEVLDAGHPEGDEHVAMVRVTTTVAPTTDVEVPVSFGWHPYFALPTSPRANWRLSLPAAEHLSLDERLLPTGAGRPVDAQAAPLGDVAFDDLFRLGGDRTVTLSDGDLELGVHLGDGYDHLQVYAPLDADVVAIEPMTAAGAALTTGAHPWAEPGSAFSAAFHLTCRRR